MEQFFYKLKNSVTSHNEILDYAVKRNPFYWVFIHSFYVTKVAPELYKNDPFISTLLERFRGEAVILKMPGKCMYNYHVDFSRSVSINILLNNFDSSHSFYKVPMTQNGKEDPNLDHIVEINYQPGDAYMLNVEKTHAVINTGGDRLVFALSFDKPLKYEEMLSFVKENNL